MESDQEDDFREGWDREGSEAPEAESELAEDDEGFLRQQLASEDPQESNQAEEEEEDDEEDVEVEGEDASDDSTAHDQPEQPGASEHEDSDDEPADLFASTADAEQLLQGMSERQTAGKAQEVQPYVLMGQQRKRARQADDAPAQEGPSAAGKAARRPASAVFGADVDADLEDAELAEQMNIGPVKGKARRMRASEKRRAKNAAAGKRTKLVPEAATRKMGEATLAYASSKYAEAMSLLWEVIRLAPNMPDAYHTLGALHENTHEPLKAINFYMIAAHLDPKDVVLWKRLAAMSTDLDPPYLRQALYCLNRVISRDKDDMDAKWDRALLLSRINEPRKAIQALQQIADLQPGDGEVAKMLARLHHRLGDAASATAVLQELLESHPDSADLTHVNMLSELLIREGQPGQVLQLIQHAAVTLCADDGLPLELQAKAGVCAAQLGDAALSREYLAVLQEADPAYMPDLFLDSADLLMAAGLADQALPLYHQANTVAELSTPELWSKLSTCYTAVGNPLGACALYRSVIADPGVGSQERSTACLALAELLAGQDSRAEALQVLDGMQEWADPAWEAANPQAATAATMQRAHLLRRLGREEEYMQLMLPLVNNTLDRIEAPSAEQPTTPPGRAQAQSAAVPAAAVGTAAGAAGQPAEGDALIKGFPRARGRRRQQRTAGARRASAAAAGVAAQPGQRPEDMAAVIPSSMLEDTDAQPMDWDAASAPQAAAQPAPAKARRKPGRAAKAADREGRAVLGNAAHDEAQFEAVVRTARALLGEGRVQEAQHLAKRSMAAFGRAKDRSRNDALELILAAVALAEQDDEAAMQAAVRMARRWPQDNVVWNCLSRAAAARGQFPTKVVAGIRNNHPASVPAALLLGSAHSLAGQHSAALEQLSHAAQLAPQQPLPKLLLGIAHATAAMGRKIPDRDRAVLLAFTYLQEYAEARGCEQEASYNLGRAAHQLGLLHLAVPLYERALTAPAAPLSTGVAVQPEKQHQANGTSPLDLRWEAAHNLVLALRASGADHLAAIVMRRYLTI